MPRRGGSQPSSGRETAVVARLWARRWRRRRHSRYKRYTSSDEDSDSCGPETFDRDVSCPDDTKVFFPRSPSLPCPSDEELVDEKEDVQVLVQGVLVEPDPFPPILSTRLQGVNRSQGRTKQPLSRRVSRKIRKQTLPGQSSVIRSTEAEWKGYAPSLAPTADTGAETGVESEAVPAETWADFLAATCPLESAEVPSVPLSKATSTDEGVYNDILKVLIVGTQSPRTAWLLRGLAEPPIKHPYGAIGAESLSWTDDSTNIQLEFWNPQGSARISAGGITPWAHAATQSLYFTDNALYLLVWDLGSDKSLNGEDEEVPQGLMSDIYGSGAYEEAEQILQADIRSNVVSWVDIIARSGHSSAILPVAIAPEGMSLERAHRRCTTMLHQLKEQTGDDVSVILDITESGVFVVGSSGGGISRLRERISEIAVSEDVRTFGHVFEHVGTVVPIATVAVRNAIRELPSASPIIPIAYLRKVIAPSLSASDLVEAVKFLASIGEILHYGSGGDLLSEYVIVDRSWLATALSCILCENMKDEVLRARPLLSSNALVPELDKASGCPLLSGNDMKMMLESKPEVWKALDECNSLSMDSVARPTVIHFLERLLIHKGVVIPLSERLAPSLCNRPEVMFVPSILAAVDPPGWTFKSSDSWKTTLCHSWLFRNGAPTTLMDSLSVAVLRDLNNFSRRFSTRENLASRPRPSSHATSDAGSLVRVEIEHAFCWKSCLFSRIRTCYVHEATGVESENILDIFVAVVDKNSPHCVASNATKIGMDRVVVSCKGPDIDCGEKLWNGGYRMILDSVAKVLYRFDNVESQVVCPSCLADRYAGAAPTWTRLNVHSHAERSDDIWCNLGHRVSTALLCGQTSPPIRHVDGGSRSQSPSIMTAASICPSIVLVGVVEPGKSRMSTLGTGFIVSKSPGLVVTAAHVLFDMATGTENYGRPLWDHQRVVIGVLPSHNSPRPVFRYIARVVTWDDLRYVDACVLQIVSRLEDDVDCLSGGLSSVQSVPLEDNGGHHETLRALRLTTNFEIEGKVRQFGYNCERHQSDQSFRPTLASGHVERVFEAKDHARSGNSNAYTPRREIIVNCSTAFGQSGGPCVDFDGMVIGILSRAEKGRCFIVPSSYLNGLLKTATSRIRDGSVIPSPGQPRVVRPMDNHVHKSDLREIASVSDITTCVVVVVGIWDKQHGCMVGVTSGFIAQAKLGLVMTSSRFLAENSSSDGHTEVVIGVIANIGDNAVYKYSARILTTRSDHAEACVLKIHARVIDTRNEGVKIEQGAVLDDHAISDDRLDLLCEPPLLASEMEEVVLQQELRILGVGSSQNNQEARRSLSDTLGTVSKIRVAKEATRCIVRSSAMSGKCGSACFNSVGSFVGMLVRDGESGVLIPSQDLKRLLEVAKDRYSSA